MSKRVPMVERRQQFVEAAARLIAAEGLERATTRRIAEEVGAPLATLHYCFHSKEELLDAVEGYLSEGFAMRLPPLPPEVRGLEAALHAHAQRVWAHIEAHPEEQVATFELHLRRYRQSQGGEGAPGRPSVEMYQAWIDSTSRIYEQAAQAAGDPVPNNLHLITQLFIAGIDGLSMFHIASPELARTAETLDILVQSLFAACTYDV